MRLSRDPVLVKCQDANVSGRYAPQTILVHATAQRAGARLVVELHVIGHRERPTGKRQKNVWANCSTLMVLRERRRARK